MGIITCGIRSRPGTTGSPTSRPCCAASTWPTSNRPASSPGSTPASWSRYSTARPRPSSFSSVAAASGGRIAGVVGWADLTEPGGRDDLARLKEQPAAIDWSASATWSRTSLTPAGWTRPDVQRGLARRRCRRSRLRPARSPPAIAGRHKDHHCAARGAVRARPRRQARDRDRLDAAVGEADRRAEPTPQRELQAVRPGHRGRTGAGAGPDRPVRRSPARQLRARPADVRLRLAGLHARGQLRRGVRDSPGRC